MKREDLDFLDNAELSSKEKVDKVMALHGKSIAKKDEEISTLTDKNSQLTDKVNTYETKIKEFDENSKDNADWKAKYEELQTSIVEQEAQKKAENEDKTLTNNIESAFGDKKFVNEYTKKALINEIKEALKNENNAGKSAKDLIEELTKDQTDIFANENQVEVPKVNTIDDGMNKETESGLKLNPMFRNFD